MKKATQICLRWLCIGSMAGLLGCVETIKESHDCPAANLTAVDLSNSEDTPSADDTSANVDTSIKRDSDNICIWDTCLEDTDCGFGEKCFLAKEYEWGRCFWEDQFGCASSDDCNPGTGMICGEADPQTVSFYEGMSDTQCRYGCNDNEDCRLLDNMRCVTSKWNSSWQFCAEGCNEDADCDTENEPMLKCVEEDSYEYKVCRERCTSDEECVEAKGEGARCNAQQQVCLTADQCIDYTECAAGEYCDSFAGCNLCKVDGDCRGPPHNDGIFCVDGRCHHCRDDSNCSNEHPYCAPEGHCVQCGNDSHCADFHVCEHDRCRFTGCKTDEDCSTIATNRGLEDLKDYAVCVMTGEGEWAFGQCKTGCGSSETTCDELRDLLPEWMSYDHRGNKKQNWETLHGSCAPPCVGGTCQNY